MTDNLNPFDGGRNPFEGTPLGGDPHWFARPGRPHTARKAALWGLAGIAVESWLTYRHTGNVGKAARTAGASAASYPAFALFGLLFGFSFFFAFFVLLDAQFALSAVLFLVALSSLVGWIATQAWLRHRIIRIRNR